MIREAFFHEIPWGTGIYADWYSLSELDVLELGERAAGWRAEAKSCGRRRWYLAQLLRRSGYRSGPEQGRLFDIVAEPLDP